MWRVHWSVWGSSLSSKGEQTGGGGSMNETVLSISVRVCSVFTSLKRFEQDYRPTPPCLETQTIQQAAVGKFCSSGETCDVN